MKTLNDIRRQIDPCLQKIEQERLDSLEKISKAKRWYILPTILLLLAGVNFFFNREPVEGSLFFSAILGFSAIVLFIIIAVYKVAPYKTNYISNFKKEAFSSFVGALYPQVYYAPGNYLPSRLFDSSGLFGSYDTYEGEDYFEGKTESGSSFKFSELKITEEDTTTDSEGNTNTTTSTVFTGLFFVLSVPDRVDGRIQVLPDTAESTFGKVGQFFQKSLGAFFQRSTMVYMEGHPEFEKEFVVYSKNAEEVYRILSPNLLQAIYDLRYKWKTRLSISFIGHYMYVAMPTDKNFFNPDMKQSVLKDKLLQELYDELALCFAVVEDLSLEHKPNESRALLNSNQKDKHNRSNSKENPFLL
jgi:hypothetical protein